MNRQLQVKRGPMDFRGPSISNSSAAACPDGIDINMEHVGGAVLNAVLPLMARGGRVVVSGLIDQFKRSNAGIRCR